MISREVMFGEWMPDNPDYKNPGVVEADGCYPVAGGYSPFYKASRSNISSSERVIGAKMYLDDTGSPEVFAGSETMLLTFRGSSTSTDFPDNGDWATNGDWAISSPFVETTGYSAATQWQFERYNDYVIAVSLENPPQYLTDMDADNAWSALPGSPPNAAQVGKVDDFLVFGDLVDNADGNNETVPYRVRWSAKNDPTAAWVTDRGELSGFRDLDPRYGRVTAIVGGRYGLVFQQRAVYRMVFVGSPKVFDFEQISVDRGCVASSSAVTIGTDTFYLSQDGFSVTNGAGVEPIGNYRVNEWFSENVDEVELSSVHGSINWPARSIVWSFKGSGASTFDKQVIYNFVLDRFSSASEEVDYLIRYKVGGETLGSLAVDYPTLADASAFTLGNQEWKARDLIFAGFVPSGEGSEFAEFNGTTAQASFATGETMIQPGRRSEVSGIWPIVEATDTMNITTQVRTRAFQGGAVTVSAPTTKGADGFCPHKVDGWLHSVRVTFPEGVAWDNAQGAIVRAKATGRR